MADIGCAVGAEDAHGRREDDVDGHNGEQSQNLRQDEVAGGVHAHDIKGVDLLGDTHGAYLRCNVRAYLSSEYKAHDATGELQKHDFAGGIAGHPAWHPRTLDVHLHLDADDGTDEERDEQHDADGVDAQLGHLLDVLLPEHAEALRHRERAAHQHEITPESRQPINNHTTNCFLTTNFTN